MSDTPDRWQLAELAVAALAIDPRGLGGIVLRDRPGPVRDAVLAVADILMGRPIRRMPGSVDPTALQGGVDLSATLKGGKTALSEGLLQRNADAVLVVPMAERMQAGVAAAVAAALDTPDAPALILLDEAAEPEEGAPDALTDRVAMSIDLEGVSRNQIHPPVYGSEDIGRARADLRAIGAADDALETLTNLAVALGIDSMRAPMLALRLARCIAALDGAKAITERHIALATALCLAPRATRMPSADETAEEAPPTPPEDTSDGETRQEQGPENQGQLEDKVLDAVAAILPDLALKPARQRGNSNASGSGDRKRSASHGRPVRSRPGKPEGKRLDVYATLLAAAPWQALRRRERPERDGVLVQPQDFRIRQYDRPAESVLIFLVDASGSQAAARMAEAKGAVELMLSEAYRRREKVALIAFRNTTAELILPPTRSLLQAKRRLAILPGGGPTPLAEALRAGRELALQVRRRGATPYLIALTDGRGNIALSGEPGRKQAAEDQSRMAQSIQAEAISSVLVDTANRPQADAKALAAQMDAQYIPLPRADAHRINRSVRAGLAA